MRLLMLDNIKIVAPLNGFNELKRDREGFLYLGKLKLAPVIDKRYYHISKYQTIVENLLITINDSEISVSNSLHKLIKGNNYSDFTFLELLNAIEIIEDITGISSNEFRLKKLEFAINIETSKPAYEYLETFSDFKGKEYDKMRWGGFWYGIKYFFTEYALKVYDKTEFAKRKDKEIADKNILRFEIQYNRQRKIPIVNTLSDLKKIENLKALFQQFIETVGKINALGSEDFSKISNRERELYFAGGNSRFWKVEKETNRNTAKDKRRKFRIIQQQIIPKNLMGGFENDLTEKFDLLIKS